MNGPAERPWFDRWLSAVAATPQGFYYRLGREVRVWGRWKRTTDMWREAGIEVVGAPADSLSVSLELEPEIADLLDRDGFQEPAVFGILDVLVLSHHSPVLGIQLRIVDADIHPVHSTALAFRMAGREAGRRLIEQGGTDVRRDT